MDTIDKEIVDDKLTQADLIKLMLHNAQHMATREEVKADITDLGSSIDAKIDKLEANTNSKFDKQDAKIDKLEANTNSRFDKQDAKIDKLEANTNSRFDKQDAKIDKLDAKFDKIQWLILATLFTVVFKDYIISMIVNH
jgi:hypothetical protein